MFGILGSFAQEAGAWRPHDARAAEFLVPFSIEFQGQEIPA